MKKLLTFCFAIIFSTGCNMNSNAISNKVNIEEKTYQEDKSYVSNEIDTGVNQKRISKEKDKIFNDTMENKTEKNTTVPKGVLLPNKIVENNTLEEKEIKEIKEEKEIATFSTDYGSWDVNRTHNMTVAVDKINDKILEPNEEFSFNDIVGERTAETGYKLSTIFVYEEKVQGYGGGICQVSSTLYNAVLGTDMEVTERHPHKRDVIYVPEGKDATVSYGTLDFKFKNTYSDAIKIKAEMKDDVLTTKIYKLT